ncbi:epoxide hydrolase family protein [Mariniluteicoccus endophyticus]
MDITSIEPFHIDIPSEEVRELHRRLDATRLAPVPGDDGFARGISRVWLEELLTAWREREWGPRQAAINEIPQLMAEVDGVRLHLAHVRAPNPTGVPVLLLHGWPDSFLRFRHVIGPLAEAGHDVVVPSLPGYGFSGHSAQSPARTADLLAALMGALGHQRFAVGGGDMGTRVALSLGRDHADRVAGLHLTDAGFPSGGEDDLDADAKAWAQGVQAWFMTEGAYAHLQSTKPRTVAPALTDSPAALASWLTSFVATGAVDGDVDAAFGGRDELLDNLSVYWFTATGGSAADAYATGGAEVGERVEVPTAVLSAPRDAPAPRSWCDRVAHVVRHRVLDEGGHFLALERPDVYAADLLDFLSEECAIVTA